jgi:hypothetical protein
MTGFINENMDNPLSLLSVKALKDLGYTVDESLAEAYTIPGEENSFRENSVGKGGENDQVEEENIGIDLRGDIVFDGDGLSELFDEVRKNREVLALKQQP